MEECPEYPRNHWFCQRGRIGWFLRLLPPVCEKVVATVRCNGGISSKWVLKFAEVVKSWMALWCGWSVWRPCIFQKDETKVVICLVRQNLSLPVTVPDLALLGPCSIWGPEVPGRRRRRMWRGWCGSRGLLLWWKSPWRKLCYGCFGQFSHRCPHSFAFFLDVLGCVLNVLFDFLAQVQCSVVDFFFSLV